MLPGIIKSEKLDKGISNVQKSSVCAVRAISGAAPALHVSKALVVGVCDMSPTDVKTSGGKGRFLLVLHGAQDKLVYV